MRVLVGLVVAVVPAATVVTWVSETIASVITKTTARHTCLSFEFFMVEIPYFNQI